MPRFVKEEEYAAKRNQIMDVAQRLIYTKGYDKMTIQDVLEGVQMSKGAFYHYFDSKEDVLEALTNRMVDEALVALRPIEIDPHLPALEKLRRYLNTGTQWKSERIDLLLPLVRGWYADDNLVARQKYFRKAMQRISGFITDVICQGVREGTMTNPYPAEVAEVILALFTTMGETLARFILTDDHSDEQFERVRRAIAMYSDTLERILGLAPGELPLADVTTIRLWFTAQRTPAEAAPAAAAV